jgi:PAS domain S-box-containing protein
LAVGDELQNSGEAEYDFIDKVFMGDQRNKTLFDWSPLAIVIINKDGVLLDANKKLYEWLGYKAEEVIGRDLSAIPFFTPETREILVNNFMKRMRGEDIPPYEVEFLHKDRTRRWGEVHGSRLKDDVNNVMLDIVMVSDVTDKKKALEGLKESEERYRNLFENANDLIQSVDAEGRFVDVNPKWLDTLEYTMEDVKNLTLADILREDQVQHCMDLFKKVFHGESVKNFEAVFVSKTGKEVYVDGSANGYFKDGRFISTVGIFRDVTERKKGV